MKYSYTVWFFLLLIIMLTVNVQRGLAQCPMGHPPGSTAFDTTILTPAGINTMQVKFPQFDPQSGMVTCVRLCITITGVLDSVSVENNSASPQTADIYYIRTDQITGPGLITPLSNSVNRHYGPYALGSSNGTLGSGPDFVAVVRDTVLNAQSVCRTLNDSATLSQFYGLDSVTYVYDISAFTNVSCTGGNYNSTVVTSAMVNFRFEYCTCPGVVLPLNVDQFNINKLTTDKAELKWTSYDDHYSNYNYEVQVSRDGRNFTTIETVAKNTGSPDQYRSLYRATDGTGLYFFRIKQKYSSGYSRFSNVKQVNLQSSAFPKFILYPNPSNGIVGIKFDNISAGIYHALILNAQGQSVVEKVIQISGNNYRQIATLQPGMYWLRLTDVATRLTCVNQILIK